jgi:hypothetical protein
VFACVRPFLICVCVVCLVVTSYGEGELIGEAFLRTALSLVLQWVPFCVCVCVFVLLDVGWLRHTTGLACVCFRGSSPLALLPLLSFVCSLSFVLGFGVRCFTVLIFLSLTEVAEFNRLLSYLLAGRSSSVFASRQYSCSASGRKKEIE